MPIFKDNENSVHLLNLMWFLYDFPFFCKTQSKIFRRIVFIHTVEVNGLQNKNGPYKNLTKKESHSSLEWHEG